MIDPVVSLQPATHRQYFMSALSLPLRWLRVTVVLRPTLGAKVAVIITGGPGSICPRPPVSSL